MVIRKKSQTGRIISGRKGSSSVFLAMAFVAFSICLAAGIGTARRLAVKSECEAFGRIWTRAILSEYDRHLLADYGLMAYFGNEPDVIKRIDAYMGYSAAGKLNIRLGKAGSDLSGFELGDPDNFRKAMNKGFAGSAVGSVIHGAGRSRHEPYAAGRVIGNMVVLDTLPSAGSAGYVSNDSVVEKAKGAGSSDGVMSLIASSGTDVMFIWKYFGNAVTAPDVPESYFRYEWEYLIGGKPEDDVNLESVRKRLFVIRNALDLAALYKDPEKVELIVSAAELITPGPLGAATQLILAEAWAALEAESDVKELFDGGRVPVLKTGTEWKTGLGSVLDSDSVRKKLDDGSRELLDENRESISSLNGYSDAAEIITEGLDYDEHLMLMILTMSRSTRLLRIMDLVQINMKYRYYRDFNLMEYYTGVRFSINADRRDYFFEDCYK